MPSVLIIEDDEIVLDLYQHLFVLEKFDVITAKNGEDGLAKAQADPPDIVLLDIMLPVMDGIEVLRRIKTDDKTKHVPVVMLTNIDDDIALGAAMKNGATDYLVKSNFTPEEIINKTKECLAKSIAETKPKQ